MASVQSATAPRALAPDQASLKIARNYVFHLMPKVRGYLSTIDALAMATVLIGQNDASLGGGGVEIGVFFGRSFYLMALLLGNHDKALAVDLFNIGPSAAGDSKQLQHFLEVGRRMGIRLEGGMAWVGDTQCLSADRILAKTGPVRFFSIDGDHRMNPVLHDAGLAADTICDHGVICFDDFCNPEFPEVTFAIFDFLRRKAGAFAPFLVSQKKLFVCKRQYAGFYRQLIENASGLGKVNKATITLLDHKTLVARSSQLEYLRCEAFARAGLGPLNATVY